MAAPEIVLGSLDDPGPDRVEDDVSADREQVGVFLDEDRAVSRLEEMAKPPVAPVVPLRVDAVEVAHAEGKVPVRDFEQQVVVVVHQAVGVTEPLIPLDRSSEDCQERVTIVIVLDDRALLVSAGDHMNHCAGRTNAERSRHTRQARLRRTPFGSSGTD